MMPSYLMNLYQDNRQWVVFVSKLFLVSTVVGAIFYLAKPDLLEQILGIFRDKFGNVPAHDANFAVQIFLQNSQACLLALLGGIILGISSFIIVFLNGFIIGFVILALLVSPGNPVRNMEYLILGLLPHGIFELPAFLFASAVGFRLGTEWLRTASVGHRWGVLKANALRTLKAIPVLAVLLIIAAFVEVFVSGSFVNNFR